MALSVPLSSQGPAQADAPYPVSRRYAWVAFAMTFGLMVSDYLSRQVINAVFPFLKSAWALSDTQLGSLVSVVALTIGLTSVPISLAADRFGRVKSAAAMGLVWCAATIACGLADGFASLLVARAVVGLGEAGYGSAGAAILAHAFPARLHATVMGSFLAAAMLGSVLGVVLGGVIAQSLGWQSAFIAIGLIGLVFAVLLPLVVKEPPAAAPDSAGRVPVRKVFATLLSTPTLIFVALAGASGMFVQTAFLAWMPSYLNRYYGLDPAKASLGTGLLILCAGAGMVLGGSLVDRLSRHDRVNRLRVACGYCLCLALSLFAAFSLEPGLAQFILMGVGLATSSSYLGPALAVAGDVTPKAHHATTFAVLSLAYMLLGAAPGPFVTGWIADAFSLQAALHIAPLGGLLGAAFFYLASRAYGRSR